MAGTETKRIIELTEASTVQSGDFIAVDSNARGTKKVPTSALATSAALTAETNARAGADEQMSERMDGIEEQTALIQNPTKTVSGSLVSFTDGADMPMVACTASIVPKQSGSGTPSPDNVRPISGRESVSVYVSPTENEADGHTTTTPLGRTVYGGTLDVVSGVLTVDRAIIDGSNLTFTYTGWTDNPVYYSNYIAGKTCSADKTGISEVYEIIDYHINDFQKTRFYIRDETAGGDASVVNSRASGHKFVYYLATPTTYQLTPTEVKTLLGDNNVWADSGDVEITYRRDISIVINNLESALNG